MAHLLARNKNWVSVQKDGKKYLRETNTMPQWAGSCWYFNGFFIEPSNDNEFANKDIIKYWMPVVYTSEELNTLFYIYFMQDFLEIKFDLI